MKSAAELPTRVQQLLAERSHAGRRVPSPAQRTRGVDQADRDAVRGVARFDSHRNRPAVVPEEQIAAIDALSCDLVRFFGRAGQSCILRKTIGPVRSQGQVRLGRRPQMAGYSGRRDHATQLVGPLAQSRAIAAAGRSRPEPDERFGRGRCRHHSRHVPAAGSQIVQDRAQGRGLGAAGRVQQDAMRRRHDGRGDQRAVRFHRRQVGRLFDPVRVLGQAHGDAHNQVIGRLVLLQPGLCASQERRGCFITDQIHQDASCPNRTLTVSLISMTFRMTAPPREHSDSASRKLLPSRACHQ